MTVHLEVCGPAEHKGCCRVCQFWETVLLQVILNRPHPWGIPKRRCHLQNNSVHVVTDKYVGRGGVCMYFATVFTFGTVPCRFG